MTYQATSREAFKSCARNTTAATVFEFIKASGGSTADNAMDILGVYHQSCYSAFRLLARRGMIRDSLRRENTRTGRSAIVWEVDPGDSLFPAPRAPSKAKLREAVIEGAKVARTSGDWTGFDEALAELEEAS